MEKSDRSLNKTRGFVAVTDQLGLTTAYGQCYGYPTALSDGTVVVIHDTRMGPGVPSGRAMISRDEGRTWQDEVYYTHYGKAVSGYTNSVVLADGTILTIAGTSDHPDAKYSWNACIGKSDLTAIRWKPARKAKVSKLPPIPRLKTGVMGGVPSPDRGALAEMHKGQYILHAKAGKITKVPVQKSRLPHDPGGHVQIVDTAVAPDGTIYVSQNTIICKSTDGGRTWTWHKRGPGPAGEDSGNPLVHPMVGSFQILNDGTFIKMLKQRGEGPARVMASRDEGRNWKKISEFTAEVPGRKYVCQALSLFRLPDDTLLWSARFDDPTTELRFDADVVMFRSEDGGKTWSRAQKFHKYALEGGIALLPSGRLLAVARYQRPLLPGDPPDLIKKTGGRVYPYKHIFLLDSNDKGRSWKNFRQLTTAFGQSYGFPAALSDGTVAVVRHNGYNPNRSGLAMISYDEGQTWQDEAYYMYFGSATAGYANSVVLKDGVILTIAGTTDFGPGRSSWDACIGKSDLTAIRWKPVKN